MPSPRARPVLGAVVAAFALSCSSAPQEMARSRVAVAPQAYRHALPPSEEGSPSFLLDGASSPRLDEWFTTERPPERSSRPAAPVCESPCPSCRLLYDEQKARFSEGRSLSPRELELVRRAYAEYLSGPFCRDTGLGPDRIGSREDIGQVFDVLDGTFTERDRRETLVLFFAGACGLASEAPGAKKTRLFVLLRQGELIASFANDEGFATFDRLVDVDGDAVHEVVVVGGWAGPGGIASFISLRSFAHGQERELGSFDTLESACGWSSREYWSSRVEYGFRETDRSLCFVERRVTQPCPALLVSDR